MVWSCLAGGFVGTLVLTALVRGASELRLTRMDLPFLLGTVITDRRRRARAIGYALHFAAGLVFSLGYAAVFAAVGRSGWLFGAMLGVLQTAFVGTVLVNAVLPVVHPRMGTPDTAANAVALIEPPGFLMLNYGRQTFLVTLIGHVAYGAIIGWAAQP
jgi:hypothetical protein